MYGFYDKCLKYDTFTILLYLIVSAIDDKGNCKISQARATTGQVWFHFVYFLNPLTILWWQCPMGNSARLIFPVCLCTAAGCEMRH